MGILKFCLKFEFFLVFAMYIPIFNNLCLSESSIEDNLGIRYKFQLVLGAAMKQENNLSKKLSLIYFIVTPQTSIFLVLTMLWACTVQKPSHYIGISIL